MHSLLNKINGTADTRPTESRQAAVNTTPHHENLQQGTLRQEPRYQENVYDDKIDRSDHSRNVLGQESLRRGDVSAQNGIPHQGRDTTRTGHAENVYENGIGHTSHGRNVLGQESLRRGDVPAQSSIPHQGRDTTRTGHAENVYENGIGHTSHGRNTLGQDTLRRHDGPIQSNVHHQARDTTRTGHAENVYENGIGHTSQGRNALGQDSLRRHHGPIQSNVPYENNAGETSYVRTGLGQENLERHDAPVHRTIAHQDGNTIKTGPVHNSEVLNKLDPRVHEHKDRSGATHHSLTGTTKEQVPLDAARVPPSVMQQHMGPPSIEHDYPEDSKHKRHSVSHQEAHLLR